MVAFMGHEKTESSEMKWKMPLKGTDNCMSKIIKKISSVGQWD